MATKTYYLAAGVDGNFAALVDGTAQAAASRTDGWTVGKIATTNASDFDVGVKQATGTFAAASGKPTALATGATANALKTPAALNGTFAATSWVFTFAVRATLVSAQLGRIKMRVYRSANADGTGATEITSAAQVGTTSALLSTTADVTTVVTWAPGATVQLANEYLFFVIAWEITTQGGSNSADCVLRTGSTGPAGSRLVTPDLVLPSSVTIGKRAAGTTVLGVTLSVSGAAPITIGRRAAATTVRGVVVDRPTEVFSIGKRSAATTVYGIALTLPPQILPIGWVPPLASYGGNGYGEEVYGGQTVYGVTLLNAGVSITIGKRAAATTVRGVTPAAVGTVQLPIGKKISAVTVRGVTITPGVVTVTIGRKASATVVKGVTVSATGAATIVIGRKTTVTTVRGVTLTPVGAVTVVIGKRTTATAVYGVTISPVGAVTVVIGRRASATTVRGVTIIALSQNTPITLAATMTLTPTMARTAKDFRTLAVTATLTPALARVLQSFRTVAATTALTPVMSRTAKFSRTVAATVILTPTRVINVGMSFPTTVTFTPVLARKLSSLRTIAVTVTLTPVMTMGRLALRTLAATTTLTPTLGKISSFFRSPSVTVTLTPAMARKLSAYRLIAPTLTLTPVMTKKLFANRTISTPVSFVADFSWSSGNAVNFPITLTFTPVLNRAMKLSKPLPATVTFIPAMQRKITKPLVFAMTMTPALTRRLSLYRTLAASGVLTPTLAARVAAGRLLAASTIIVAGMVNSAPRFRTLNATVTFTPSISLLSGKGKVLNATTTLVPTLKKLVGKSMSASLNFITNIQRKSTTTMAVVVTLTPVVQKQSRSYRRFDSVAVLQVALQKGAGRKILLSVPVPFIAFMTSGRVNRVILSASAFFTALLDKVSAKARKAEKTLFSTSLPDAELLGVRSTNVPAELDAVTDEEISQLLSANGEKSELTSVGEEAPSLRSVT